MKRKIVSIIIIIFVLLSLFSINVSAETADISGGQLLKQYMIKNDIIDETTLSTKLTTLDEANINAEFLQNYIDSNKTAQQCYGGCYIDDDNKLHVLFTSETQDSIINAVNTITNNSVVIENCEYTLNELEMLKEKISDIMVSELRDNEVSEIADDIVAVGLYQKQNKIFVQIKNCTKEKIYLFRKRILDSDAIVFETSDGCKNHTTSLKSGWSIAVDTSTGTWGYSIAFRCKYLKPDGNYALGFMTAAHGNSAGDIVYNSSKTKQIGYIMAWCYTNNGRIDAAFVCITNEEYNMTNDIRSNGGSLVSGAYANTYTEGNTVYMAGGESSLVSGKIISSSAVVEGTQDDPVTIRDCVEASYLSVDGDSGGLVYIKQSGNKYVAGINIAGCSINGVNTSSFFVKVKNIKERFNIVLY